MAVILYISLDGMTEALGESQVVQYLLELNQSNRIFLFSFEKLTDKQKYDRMKNILREANIHWTYFEYSNRYGVLSTVSQILLSFFTLTKLIAKEKIQIVHARSLIPAIIGSLLKKFYNIKLLFDIRGFAIDEKIMHGRLKKRSLLTFFLRKIERSVYRNSDHIVTLTHVSKPIIEEKYLIESKNITVIPTCANIDLFKSVSREKKTELKQAMGFASDDFIILHNGSLNGWVDFDAQLKLFEQFALLKPQAKFLFLNKGQHSLILSKLEEYKIDKERCKLLAIDFDQVCHYLNISDVCIFFIKPSFAKKASAPTKFAELVACHVYSVTNTQYGDMEYYLNSYRVGKLVELDTVHVSPKNVARDILESLDSQSDQSHDFYHLFSEHFSKKIAVKRYQHIYASMQA